MYVAWILASPRELQSLMWLQISLLLNILAAESNCFQRIAVLSGIVPADKSPAAKVARTLNERGKGVYHVSNEAKKVELRGLPKVIHTESTGNTSNQE